MRSPDTSMLPAPHLAASKHRRGFALVEVSISLVIFAIASGIMLQAMRAGYGLRGQAREEWLATAGAQSVLETMRGMSFRNVSLNFDQDPFNDPGGPGTSFGAAFDIEGLDPALDDADGRVGEVLLPVVNVGTAVAERFELREDLGDALIGMPRDLNGDAIIDSIDHRDDAALLPVLVRVRWNGRNGPRQLEFYSALTEATQ